MKKYAGKKKNVLENLFLTVALLCIGLGVTVAFTDGFTKGPSIGNDTSVEESKDSSSEDKSDSSTDSTVDSSEDSSSEDSSSSNTEEKTDFRYEAEDAEINSGVIKSGYGDGSASGSWVGDLNFGSSNILFVVNVEVGGRYVVNISYATQADEATMTLSNDGIAEETVYFSSTGDWGCFSITQVEIELVTGENYLYLIKGNESVEIDYIELITA